MHVNKFKTTLAGLVLAIMTAFGGSAIAQTMNVYTWDGLCSDCSPLGDTPAKATLTLQNYTPGTDLTAANFVSFSYSSLLFPSGLSFIADGASTLSGILPSSGDAAISLSGLTDLGTGAGSYSFTTQGDGSWMLALNGISFDEHGRGSHSSSFRHDHDERCGSRCSPSPIPEPETYAMILAGLGLMGFVARRRKQSIA